MCHRCLSVLNSFPASSLCPPPPPPPPPPPLPQVKIRRVSDYSRISACYSSTVLKCLLQNRSSITERLNGKERRRWGEGGVGSDGEVNEGLKM